MFDLQVFGGDSLSSVAYVAYSAVFEIFPPFSRQDDKEVCVVV